MNRSAWKQAIWDVNTALSNTRCALDAAENAWACGERSEHNTSFATRLRSAWSALDAARDIADDGLLYANDDD